MRAMACQKSGPGAGVNDGLAFSGVTEKALRTGRAGGSIFLA